MKKDVRRKLCKESRVEFDNGVDIISMEEIEDLIIASETDASYDIRFNTIEYTELEKLFENNDTITMRVYREIRNYNTYKVISDHVDEYNVSLYKFKRCSESQNVRFYYYLKHVSNWVVC